MDVSGYPDPKYRDEPTDDKIVLRSYKPRNNIGDLGNKAEPMTVKSLIEDKLKLLEAPLGEPEPKNVDWDLKCRIQKQMQILDRQTRRHLDKHVKGNKS